jgi:hypothetical protein
MVFARKNHDKIIHVAKRCGNKQQKLKKKTLKKVVDR